MRNSPRHPAPAPLQVDIVDAALTATSSAEQRFARVYVDGFPEAVAYGTEILDYDRACDIVQDAALELYHRWGYLTPDQQSLGYFLRACRSRLIDEVRREDRAPEARLAIDAAVEVEIAALHQASLDPPAPGDDEPESAYAVAHADGRVFYPEIIPSRRVVAEERAQQALLARAVDRFTKRERQIWGFCVLQRLTTKQAAGILEIAPVTARRHLSRAIAVIRDEATRSGHTIGEPALQRFLAATTEVDHD